ncbi:tetratricopeptide repeat protein [Geomonas terrae]|nr:tetratricopeptide repeat protein [Geomonas terrae]
MGKERAARQETRQNQSPAAGVRRSPFEILGGSAWLQLALIALVGLLAYSNTFHAPFVIDDEGSITENPVIKNLASFLFDGTGYRYNPRRFIGYLTFALNYNMGGLEVTGYHIFNTAVHLLNGAFVFLLLRLTQQTPFFKTTEEVEDAGRGIPPETLAPLIAALLFVAHPIQTQAITYVVQRFASLATLFYLASLTCYILARLRQEARVGVSRGGTITWYIAALLCALLAMKTKEIAFTLPLTVALYELSFFGTPSRKRLLLLLPLAATLLVVPLGLMQSGKPLGEMLGEMDRLARETTSISRGDYLLTQFSVIVTYLRLMLIPIGQNLDYDYPVFHTLFAPRVFLSLLLLVALAGTGIYLYRRSSREPWQRLAGFGIFWFFITLSVESSVIPIRDVIFEHRVYLPSVGIFCAAAALLAPLLARLAPRAAAAAVGVVVLVLAVTTWQRNLVWGSAVTLWQDCAGKAPGKARPHNNLAIALLAAGRNDEAAAELKTALKLDPGNVEALRNLGAAYEKTGGVEQAISQYRAALQGNPDNKYAHYNLAVAYSKQGKTDQALSELQLALKVDPEYPDAHNNLGVLYANQGLMKEAIAEFSLAVKYDPRSAEGHKNLGFALGMNGKQEEGMAELRTAADLQPENPEIYNSMGIMYANQGRFRDAASAFEKAVQLSPQEQKYLNNLYHAKAQGG